MTAEKTTIPVSMVWGDDGKYSFQLEDGTVLTDDMACKILAANNEDSYEEVA